MKASRFGHETLDPSASVEENTLHLLDTSEVAGSRSWRGNRYGQSMDYGPAAGHEQLWEHSASAVGLPWLGQGGDSGRRFPGIHILNSSVIQGSELSAFQGEGSHYQERFVKVNKLVSVLRTATQGLQSPCANAEIPMYFLGLWREQKQSLHPPCQQCSSVRAFPWEATAIRIVTSLKEDLYQNYE